MDINIIKDKIDNIILLLKDNLLEQTITAVNQFNLETIYESQEQFFEIHDFCLRTPMLEFKNESTIYFINYINCFNKEERESILWDLDIRQCVKRHQHNESNQYTLLLEFVNEQLLNFNNLPFYKQTNIIKIASFYKNTLLLQMIKNYLIKEEITNG